MTHEEIKSAIERLEKLCEEKSYLAYDVMRAIIGKDFPDLYDNIGTLKNLLQQADPDTHMELPVDADGEVIHLGDELTDTDPHHAGSFTVEAIGGNSGFIPHVVYFRCDDGNLKFHYTTQCRHYHKPTVEDVLTELVDVAIGDIADKVRNENMTYNDWAKSNEVIAEYADKLREVMDDDDAR